MVVLGLIWINFPGMNTGWPNTLPVLVATTDLTGVATFFFSDLSRTDWPPRIISDRNAAASLKLKVTISSLEYRKINLFKDNI